MENFVPLFQVFLVFFALIGFVVIIVDPIKKIGSSLKTCFRDRAERNKRQFKSL